jgi:hypothetical protein
MFGVEADTSASLNVPTFFLPASASNFSKGWNEPPSALFPFGFNQPTESVDATHNTCFDSHDSAFDIGAVMTRLDL